MLRNSGKIILYSDSVTFPCEICGITLTPATAYSMTVVYSMPGPGFAGDFCPAQQHFACCHEHAVLSAAACLLYHMDELVPHNKTGSSTDATGGQVTDKGATALKALLSKYVPAINPV